MPYNYLLNEMILERSSQLYKGAIIIFDEGHNVPGAACDGFSSKLGIKMFKGAIKNIEDKN